MGEYSAYQSDELAALYDAVYADSGDVEFWLDVAPALSEGPLLELGCGTGRVLLPLARVGHEVVGLDRAPHMLGRASMKLVSESPEVRDRVTLLEGDMTSFGLGRTFAMIYCAFGTFHHLRTVEEQLACLERVSEHLRPGGTLVLDLINPDPAPTGEADETRPVPIETAKPAELPNGRRVESWATVIGTNRALQCNDVEVTYEVNEPDGSTTRLVETFPMRFVFRYELEHLLARQGFKIDELYGDYDRSPFTDESLGMIVVARRVGG